MYSRALAASAAAYAVAHHLGLLPAGLGPAPEGTRWADWLDLLVPWFVLAPAAVTLWAARASAGTWAIFGAGVVAYTSGHGIHLAANSVANNAPGETAHLWDEVVGHYIWYAGVALVVAALVVSMAGRPRPHAIGYFLALGVGATWATNAVGGDTVVFGLVLALAAAASGWTRRDELGVVLLVGALPAAIGLGVAQVLGLS
ncbi:MAG: hypothetical protein ACXWXO_18985 [Nocardioides sp.]